MTIYDRRHRWRSVIVWKVLVGFQSTHMKHWVDPVVGQQFQTASQLGCAHRFLNLEWPNETECKLSTQSALQPEVFDGTEHQDPRLKLRGWVPTLIRIVLHAILSSLQANLSPRQLLRPFAHKLPNVRVQPPEVGDGGIVRVLATVQHEWRVLDAVVPGIVQSEFNRRQQFVPILLERAYKVPQRIFEDAIDTLHLPVCLRVIGR